MLQARHHAIVEAALDLSPPVGNLDVAGSTDLTGVLIDTDQPEDRLAPGSVGMPGQPASSLLGFRPGGLALNSDVFNAPGLLLPQPAAGCLPRPAGGSCRRLRWRSGCGHVALV